MDTSSGTRGAKQLVVETIHSTFSTDNYFIFYSIASCEQQSESPINFSSITTGIRLAVIIDLRQVFWSMRDQITYFFYGYF